MGFTPIYHREAVVHAILSFSTAAQSIVRPAFLCITQLSVIFTPSTAENTQGHLLSFLHLKGFLWGLFKATHPPPQCDLLFNFGMQLKGDFSSTVYSVSAILVPEIETTKCREVTNKEKQPRPRTPLI